MGAWSFQFVVERLRAAGHDARALPFRGVGERAAELSPDLDNDVFLAETIATLEKEDLRDIVLVGHSFGSLIATLVTDRIPERIGHLVIIDGGIATDGQSIFGAIDRFRRGTPDPGAGGAALGALQPTQQGNGQLQRRLAAELHDHPFGLFHLNNVEHVFEGERLEIEAVAGVDLSALIAERALDFSITTQPAPVRAHEWALRELSRNLLHNAVRHAPPGSELTVDLRSDGRHVALTISDHGPGIDDELAARLFQPFSAGDVRTGSGLGLAICREIVQALEGSITLTNRIAGHRVAGLDAVRCGRWPARSTSGTITPMNTLETMRLDKWLWCARFYKTRSLATDEIGKGRVTVNGQLAKPARDLRCGDTVALRQGPVARTVRVLGLSGARGPAPV
eukprot:gene40427-53446_t